MSIPSGVQGEINRVSTALQNAYTSIANKGGIAPSISDDLYDAIMNIPEVTPWDGSWTYAYAVDIVSSDHGQVIGAGAFPSGESCTLTAIPYTGYAFSNWKEGSTQLSTSNPYTFTVTKNRSISANYSGLPVTLTTSGSGNSTYCFATINGRSVTSSGTYTVHVGDSISFNVYGYSSTYYGEVRVDGVQQLKVTDKTTHEYIWTVPDTASNVTVSFSYTSTSTRRNGRITVVTS